MRVIYKYDKLNRIQSYYTWGIGLICNYKYKNGFVKQYHFVPKINAWGIRKIMESNKNNFSLLEYSGKRMVYKKYEFGMLICEKFYNIKTGNIFERKNLLRIGDSEINETKFKGKKNIEIITKQDGRNKQRSRNPKRH